MTLKQHTQDALVKLSASRIAQAICGLADKSDMVAVVQVFKDESNNIRRNKKDILCSAFWMLDNSPGYFANKDEWHPALRCVRNSPEHGEKLFALFS